MLKKIKSFFKREKIIERLPFHHEIDLGLEATSKSIEFINEITITNYQRTLVRLDAMNLAIQSLDSIIRRVDKRIGEAEILLGIQKAQIIQQKSF